MADTLLVTAISTLGVQPADVSLRGSLRSMAGSFGAELACLGVLGAGILLFLARLGQVSGAKLLFYNSDSLTMPLFARALTAPEGLGWTSGPFLGIFPELPTFLIADSLTSTPKSALVVCGFLNLTGLYLAMRLLAGACGGTKNLRRQAGLSGIVAVTLGMAAETFTSSEWNLGWMLFSSTYYVGVSTMGVVTVALVARMLNAGQAIKTPLVHVLEVRARAPFLQKYSVSSRDALRTHAPKLRFTALDPETLRSSRSKQNAPALPPLTLSVALFAVCLLTTISNPMFSVVVAVPCAAAIVVFLFARRCAGTTAGVALCSLLMGTAMGYLLQPFLGMVGASVEGYFHWDRIGVTARMVTSMAKTLLGSPFGVIELVTLLTLVTIALVKTAVMVLHRPSASENASAREVGSTGRDFGTFFVASWIILAPFALIITGPGVTRYFGTFAVFPFLLLVANYSVLAQRFERPKLRRATALVVGVMAAIGVASLPSARATANLAPPSEIDCVSATVAKGSSGIAEFWTARPIDIFNTAGARVLQASAELGVSGWISNPAEFTGRDFTFVLTSWKENYKRIQPITAKTVARLGPPSRVTHCGELDVYEYWVGTPGHKRLNDGLRH
jgi:hypothetical protein